MAFQDLLESLQLKWAELNHIYRNYWRKTPLEEYIPEADVLEMVRLGTRGQQTGYSVGGESGEGQGILWIILVLIEIGVVSWVLLTVMITLCIWWAGVFKREEGDDWEEEEEGRKWEE
ncbi:hypothetical protein L873DRAFT_1385941 [Choiromyces venosus 120613-1]|uniref:Uncharacterized protein n=1 Tax=Choiromyces venosus 120613-1 TaxID=1336337 RepID=A0A3N4JCY6_9PEZI|nr:hypothetical protein L873DRAFT_1385941 [Choiromyces venosus 120613-1]